jgi:hypothetical protein
MGVVRTIKGEDGKPYISLEDLIKEVEEAKNYAPENSKNNFQDINFVDIVLKTLHNMEEEYYDRFLFKKRYNI